MGYYKVDVSSPDAFYQNVIGKGFDEGFGMQCVAGFKEFTYSLCGRIVACNEGKAKCYADQASQICDMGFTRHSGNTLYNGDWVVFGGSEYGHIAMYYNGMFLGQNQIGGNIYAGSPFTLVGVNMPILCCYRPNIYVNAPKPTPSKSIDEVAKEVIAGKWGNGEQRATALRSAGYSYAAVQNRVNEMLSAQTVRYTIQYGDCLSVIAEKFGTTVEAIQSLNGITNPDLIYAGTTIRVK